MTGSMEKLREVIASHDEDITSAIMAEESGLPRSQVSSLVHTLICERSIFKRRKVGVKQYYNRLPIPQWN